ncbi:hypothetical protein BCAR13_500025 [Paraburkholderia caribensis]|nr:hypothetical protein BCAR13_500025 [Paraburkholderia caribensis]
MQALTRLSTAAPQQNPALIFETLAAVLTKTT